MKVLFLTCHPKSKGGISTWVRSLQSYDKSKGLIDAEYIYPAYSGNAEATVNRTLFGRVFGGTQLMFRRMCDVQKAVSRNRPDVAHITTSGELAILRDLLLIFYFKRSHIPVVYHIRFGRIPQIRAKKALEWRLLLAAMKKADAIIAIDGNTFRSLNEEECLHGKLFQVPNLIDASSLPDTDNVYPEKEIIYIGWCIKTKGIEELLGAWQKLRKEHRGWSLRLVGPYNEQYMDELKARFCMEGIRIDGELPHRDVMLRLRSATIFVLPSYTEGFPYSVLEAMALKKPIIATTVGAIPEMLAGNCGLLIEPMSEESLKQALCSLISDEQLRELYGKNAYRKMISNYQIDVVFQRYMEIWNSQRKQQ